MQQLKSSTKPSAADGSTFDPDEDIQRRLKKLKEHGTPSNDIVLYLPLNFWLFHSYGFQSELPFFQMMQLVKLMFIQSLKMSLVELQVLPKQVM